MKLCSSITLSFLLLAAPAGAAELSPQQIVKLLGPLNSAASPSYEEVLAVLTRPLRAFDMDHDGLDRADLNLARSAREAQIRGPNLGVLLGFDLNNDRRLTRDEYEMARRALPVSGPRIVFDPEFGPYPDPRFRPIGYDPFVVRDANSDGVLTWEEMTALIPAERFRAEGGSYSPELLLETDPTQDGKFTLKDASALADLIFAKLDTDKDGSLSQAEIKTIEGARRTSARESVTPPMNCAAPQAEPRQEVVRIGANRGALASSVSVGRSRRGSRAVRVKIEPGDDPLYLVVTGGESIVWVVEGETQRVDRIVAAGGEPQGVAGVDASKVTFIDQKCLKQNTEFSSVEGLIAKGETAELVKKTVAAAGGDSELELISVPGMTIAPPRRQRLQEIEVVELDPSRVVATTTPERYALLPGKAGLDALVRAGTLEIVDQRTYKIVKPIDTLPANLANEGVRMILSNGLAAPGAGDERMCIVREDTGELVSGKGTCR